MSAQLQDYTAVVGENEIAELRAIARRVEHRHLQHIISAGGRAAEVLPRLLPLMRELGVTVSWDVMKYDASFYRVERAWQRALEGEEAYITDEMLELYMDTMSLNLRETELRGDTLVMHDIGAAGMVMGKESYGNYWIWRCHYDVSAPLPAAWSFLKPIAENYDSVVFSMTEFAQYLSVPQYLIPPAVDPLDPRNTDLPDAQIESVLERFEIDARRPILFQFSRLERQRDPLGVIKAYQIVKRRHDCQLVLLGKSPSEDPEETAIMSELQELADRDADIHILSAPPVTDTELNALVRASAVVIQKSTKEGSGLSAGEAMWKRKPVIGGAAGVLKSQILNGVTGYTVFSPEGAASRILTLLNDPRLRTSMGDNGHEYVKQNFLVTRQLKDYLLLLLSRDYPDTDLVDLT